jgi:bile acid:Na+ symporter, BASS family
MHELFVVFDVSLALTVFSFGLQAQKAEDVRFILSQPRLLLLSLLAMFVLTPTLALVIAETTAIPLTAQAAVVALSLSMISPTLPQKETEAGGHGRYGIGLVIIVCVLAPVGVPLLVSFLARLQHRSYGVSPVDIGVTVVGLVLAPLIAGVVFGWLFPGATKAIRGFAPRVAGYVTLAALVVLMIAVFPLVWHYITGWVLLAALLYNVGALGIGHLMGGPEPDRSIVLAVSCAGRHPAIAFTVLKAVYPDKNFAAAVIVILVVNGILYPLYLKRARSRVPAAGQVPGPAVR